MSASVDGRAERWWNHESGFVYRTSGLEQSGGAKRLSTSSGACILLPAPAVTMQMQVGG